jgi:hypothetical protein
LVPDVIIILTRRTRGRDWREGLDGEGFEIEGLEGGGIGEEELNMEGVKGLFLVFYYRNI